jgi:uncharacterized membrane protein YeaQ/YmgE (transglycosylase-associated protein family)
MLSLYVSYFIVYVVVGALTGYVGARIMPGRTGSGRVAPLALATVGAVAGGVGGLLLFGAGPSYETTYRPGYAEGTTLPAYWITPIFAFVAAMLALAAYKLTDRDPSVA